DRDELAVEDPLGEECRMAGLVGFEAMAVEHAGRKSESDVHRLGWHGGLEAGAEELTRGEGSAHRNVLPRPESLDGAGQIEGSEGIVDRVVRLGIDREGVRASLRQDRKRVRVARPLDDRAGERGGRERLCRSAADEEDLAERLVLGIGEPPSPEIEELPREKVRRRLQCVAGDQKEEISSAGAEMLREANEEAVLKASELAILIVGRVQVEDGGAPFVGDLSAEPEGVALETEVGVGKERPSESPSAFSFELTGADHRVVAPRSGRRRATVRRVALDPE